MSPNRETGNSAVMMVLILLLTGTMMLSGLSVHLDAQRQSAINEIRAIVRYAGAQSALTWGEWQSWFPQNSWQCQRESVSALAACLYQTLDNEALLAGFLADGNVSNRLVLWRWGQLKKGKFVANAHGWLDYCPLSDKTRCNLAL